MEVIMKGLREGAAAAVTAAQGINVETRDTPKAILCLMDMLSLSPGDLCLSPAGGITYKTRLIIDGVSKKMGRL